jgi:hypothetical protein
LPEIFATMKLPVIAALLLALIAAGPAFADRDSDRGGRSEGGSGMSAQQAAEAARRQTG